MLGGRRGEVVTVGKKGQGGAEGMANKSELKRCDHICEEGTA